MGSGTVSAASRERGRAPPPRRADARHALSRGSGGVSARRASYRGARRSLARRIRGRARAAGVVLHAGDVVATEVATRARGLARRRLAGEPVDRILALRGVLGQAVPALAGHLVAAARHGNVVEAALASLPDGGGLPASLDLGTGTGAILVAVLREGATPSAWASTCSDEAAATARDNAALNGVGDRAAFVVGDWADFHAGHFDLVVSNPPYIARGELTRPRRRSARPRPAGLALCGGSDGLDAYRVILAQLASPGGALAGAGPRPGVLAGLGSLARRQRRPTSPRAAGLVPDARPPRPRTSADRRGAGT